ncbi:MAG: hypothetical protein KIH62_000735 [Candidatus Kerfeldbacteria bacterium]|nr:hypothetical protein [Candidatus Kerfeldbacteria bacterium]
MKFSWRRFLLWVGVPSVIIVCGFASFWEARSLGAYGDDSAGYIYLAGRLFHHQPLMFISDLGKQAIDFFGDEKLARWIIPTHHQYINPSGMAASKYPLLLSVLMALSGTLIDAPRGFFIVQPLSSIGILVGTYILTMLLFAHHKRDRFWLACGAVVSLYASSLFFEATLSQPMREIPAMCFLIWSFIALFIALRASKNRFVYTGVAIAGSLFGAAVAVRETLILTLPALVACVLLFKIKERSVWKILLTAFFFFLLACIPLMYTSVSISSEKVVFKKRDVSTVVIVPNIGHIQTISLNNLFHNDGKFNAGEGSLPTYIRTINTALPIPLFGLLILYGFVRLFHRERKIGIILLLWALPIFALYSLWINPYGRYILPLYPIIMIVVAYGMYHVCIHDIPQIFSVKKSQRFMQSVLIIACCAYLFGPLYQHALSAENIFERNDREFTRADVNAISTLDDIASGVPGNVILMFAGDNEEGVSETVDAYTGRMSIRFPIDKKYSAPIEKVRQFFAEYVFPQYTVLAVIDDSTSSAFYEWAKPYTLTELGSVPFTFQSHTRVVQITP